MNPRLLFRTISTVQTLIYVNFFRQQRREKSDVKKKEVLRISVRGFYFLFYLLSNATTTTRVNVASWVFYLFAEETTDWRVINTERESEKERFVVLRKGELVNYPTLHLIITNRFSKRIKMIDGSFFSHSSSLLALLV